jgi:hypothetical protein
MKLPGQKFNIIPQKIVNGERIVINPLPPKPEEKFTIPISNLIRTDTIKVSLNPSRIAFQQNSRMELLQKMMHQAMTVRTDDYLFCFFKSPNFIKN